MQSTNLDRDAITTWASEARRNHQHRGSNALKAVALMLGLLSVLLTPGLAQADTPTGEAYTNLNMRCLGTTDDGQVVELYVIRRSDEPGTTAELFLTSADGEEQQMWTSTDAVIGDGMVSARFALGPTEVAAVTGIYRPSTHVVTRHLRVRIENSVVIDTLEHQAFSVELTTSELGPIGRVDLYCDVEEISQSSNWTNPHRVTRRTSPAVQLGEDCAVGPVTSAELLAADGETLLVARTADAVGYGYVSPNGAAGQIVWYDSADEVISVQPVELSLRRSGAPLVSTTADGTTTTVVRATPHIVELTFGLPGGEPYDARCGGRVITSNISTSDTGR